MSGFLDTIADGIETAFTLGAEFVTTGTYTRKDGNHTYDPATDDLVAENPNVLTGVRFLRTKVDVQEREASPVSITDTKFLVPGVDLGGLLPGPTDFFQLDTGERWNVLISQPTPGNKLIIIFARKA
jgi:hypothetical protein